MFILLCLTFVLSFTTGKTNVRLMNNTRLKIINGHPNENIMHYYNIRAGSTYYYKGYVHHLSRVTRLNPENSHGGKGLPRNDVILIKVTPQFQFSSIIRPAKMPKVNDLIPEVLWVSGWGITEYKEISKKLRVVAVKKVPYNRCREIALYSAVLIEDQHLCYGGQGVDSCQGDSGGPLADYETVYGIASFGALECGRFPGVYESVSHYSDWIEYTIQT
ncbi:trypsin epsilon isoform X2 [Cotesia typhae]|uniref:trypsin epsilon isoform X2 n=1 Tax=Cotesia typhae TaxID=2053667 RepID=UPI003D694B11